MLFVGASLPITAPLVAQTIATPVDRPPAEVGRWLPPARSPVLGIHAAVLPTGKVLLYSYPAMNKFQAPPPTDRSAQAADIQSVVLISLSAVTHSVNTTQRLVDLQFTSNAQGRLTVTAPRGGKLAPPGHYMLFILNSRGVPSLAKIVRLATSPSRDTHAPV